MSAAETEVLIDPACALLAAGTGPDVRRLAEMHPRPQGEPAFDPELIASNAARLQTVPRIDTGCSLLDRAVAVGLAHIDATFQGDHPKYGIKVYGREEHDAFPPVIIAAVDALSAWGLHQRAAALVRHWLRTFIAQDGRILYYGPSIAEYGQLLWVARVLALRHGLGGWWRECRAPLARIALYLIDAQRQAAGTGGLIAGTPEADERDQQGVYFHNNAWAARGLTEWAALEAAAEGPGHTRVATARQCAQDLRTTTLTALRSVWPVPPHWWVPPQPGTLSPPEHLTSIRLASYTNYRYWPELLSSGLLPEPLANELVETRRTRGGQFCGTTRFEGWLDDWPLADYLYGLHRLGRMADFRLALYGHVLFHQADGHLTAYEQVTLPPGREKAAYCLPCQLVAPRAARLLQQQS